MAKLIFSAVAALALTFACGSDPAPSPTPGASSAGAGGTGLPAVGGAGISGGAGVQNSAGSAVGGGGSGAGAPPAGGSDAGSGGSSAGSGGSSGGSGGQVTADGYTKIFNGVDLTGWYPLIHKSAYKADPYNTFRADPVNKVLKVTYEDYPDSNFDERCGLIYYDKYLTNYRVRVTYRFLEPQAQNPVGWGKNNTGLMIFGLDPTKVTGDPMFPPLIEIQLLGTPSSGGSTNINLCQPGGMNITSTAGCGDNHTNVPAPPAAEWVTVEAEVHVTGDTKVYQYPDKTTPVMTMHDPMYDGKPVLGGYLSLQSESQPLEFKDIELKELDQ